MKTLVFVLALLTIPLTTQNKPGMDITTTELSQFEQEKSINNYIQFKERLGALESSGRYDTTNITGKYLGKYQFGQEALTDIGFDYSAQQFLSSQKLQEEALLEYLKLNRERLSTELREFVGDTIKGIPITESGLLAAAHLGGVNNVKRFLYTEDVFSDGNGTELTSYLEGFSNYEFELNLITHKPPNHV